jgi:hypothetical protein
MRMLLSPNVASVYHMCRQKLKGVESHGRVPDGGVGAVGQRPAASIITILAAVGLVAKPSREPRTNGDHEMMSLRTLLEKSSDADLLREMVGLLHSP